MKKSRPFPYLNPILKTLLVLLLSAGIYYELTSRGNLRELWAAFQGSLHSGNWYWLAISVFLLPYNWLAETEKWHQFIHRYQPSMTKWQAYKAVLAGISFSLFTPNRVGEYGGRILFVAPKHQWKAVIANLVGNFAQIMILFLTGVAGATWFMYRFMEIDPYWVVAYSIFSFAGLCLMFFAFFNIDLVIPFARRVPWLNHIKRFVKDIKVLRHYNRRELAEVLAWALLRYLIYSTQYYCLLRFFDINPGLFSGYLCIGAIFLLQTSIPLPPVMGLLARGNVAVHVWSYFGANEISILAATFGLWILNLILPALVGTFFIFGVNITKSLGYEDDTTS